MKTFSELRDRADQSLRIQINCTSACVVQPCTATIRINGLTLFTGRFGVEDWNSFREVWVDINSPICIEVTVDDLATGDAFYVKNIGIDNHNIIPMETSGAFRMILKDGTVTPVNGRIRQPGTWQFFITEPFYQWHHRQTGQGWLLEP